MHDLITHFTSGNYQVLADSAQIPLWDTVIHDTAIHSIPRGMLNTEKLPRAEGEGPIPSRDSLAI